MKLEPRCPDLKYSDLKLKMYCCELTRAIDCEMSQEHKRTYLVFYSDKREVIDGKSGNVWVFRSSGATRGYILTDKKNKIEVIKFYYDQCKGFYSESVWENVKNFIGEVMEL